MARIGIITCSNLTQDLGCVSSMCLAEIKGRNGNFKDYPSGEEIELVGLINCSGCPGAGAPQKILRRVRPLVELQVDAIHLSTCMSAICPFIRKYEQVINETYPEIKVVIGTHAGNTELLRDYIKGYFSTDMAGLYKEHLKNQSSEMSS